MDAARLLAVIKEMPDDAVRLETEAKQFETDGKVDERVTLHVRGAKSHFKLLAMRASDFPPFHSPDEGTPVPVKASELRRMVGQTVFAVSKENGNFGRAGVFFKVSGGRMELVSNDERRLALSSCTIESTATAR